MFLTWWRHRRRKELLSKHFPPQWVTYLQEYVAPYVRLSAEEQARSHVAVRILVAEKHWEECGGFTITDEVRVTIAGFASLLVLGLKDNYFDHVATILVYPDAYVVEGQAGKGGLLIGESARVGEAHYRGPVVLSWSEIHKDALYPNAGKNVILHEFAHQLDMLNGSADGIPDLANAAQDRRWREVLEREYGLLVRQAEGGWPTLLDKYGAVNEAEFFAVATECFFLKPQAMLRRHGDMYNLMREYFQQNPAERANPWESP